MIVLDTDHLSEFQKGSTPAARHLRNRLETSGETVATTIVSCEELMRGWLAAIHRQREPRDQLRAYQRLHQLFIAVARWHVLDWDEAAIDRYEQLRRQKVRIGTMDLKIASIALVHDATILTGNLRDFQRVPNLHVEDWL
jgi:tRNA(fMet)-specific endonuclease VapC